MEIHQLRYFVATADAGSMTLAARRCHVAQPSLSQQIKKLETSLGHSLFDRLGKGVALTSAGVDLLPRARQILTDVEDIKQAMQEDRAEAQRLSVGAIPTIAPYLLPKVVRELRQAAPDCAITLREDLTDRLLESLADNAIDIAVLSLPITHDLIEATEVGQDGFVAAVAKSHPLASADRVSLSDLRDEPNIVLSSLHCLGQQLEAFCASRHMDRQIVCEATQLTTVLEMVRSGLGVSIVPEMAVRARHVSGVSFVPLSQRGASRPIAIAVRHARSRSALSELFHEIAQREVTQITRRP